MVGLICLHRFCAKLCGLVCVGKCNVRESILRVCVIYMYFCPNVEWFKVRGMRNEIKEIGLPSGLLIIGGVWREVWTIRVFLKDITFFNAYVCLRSSELH